jgi:NADP-dependent 3-hydroxy acid dehydrogenase YdfG
MNKIVLITGATSGIGQACAETFASNQLDIIITGRRKNKLAELKIYLENKYKINVIELCFDVQNKHEVSASLDSLPEKWKKIEILINNAGLALGRDSFENASVEEWETMLQTNVNGLIYVTKKIVPFMIAGNAGHIINIGSIAGKEVYENGNVYCASKFAVDAISKSMRIDLLKYGIKVTAIHPGAVETEFSIVRFNGDKEKAAMAYKGYTPLQAKDVADSIFYTANLPKHVCINELIITCTQQANASYFNKNL